MGLLNRLRQVKRKFKLKRDKLKREKVARILVQESIKKYGAVKLHIRSGEI